MNDTKELRRLAQAALIGPDGFSMRWLSLLKDFQEEANPSVISEIIDRLEAAEKDIALKERVIDSLGSALNAAANERDALRARIDKLNVQNSAMLKALLAIADWNSVWGPFPEKNEHWRAMAIVTAREATRAFEQGEQK